MDIDNEMDIDINITEPLWSLLRCCEVHCVAACCGLDAFDFHPVYTQDWLQSAESETLRKIRQQLRLLRDQTIQDHHCYISEQLNFWGDQNQWHTLISNWEKLLMQQNIAIPILPTTNLNEAIDFYKNLGFQTSTVVPENYAILDRDSIELHLSYCPQLIPTESYTACYLRVSQVDELFQEFIALCLPQEGIPRIECLEDKSWGMREFAIVDPSGNLLRIGQPLE